MSAGLTSINISVSAHSDPVPSQPWRDPGRGLATQGVKGRSLPSSPSHCIRQIQATPVILSFPGSPAAKESTCNAGDKGDLGSIPGLGKSPRNGNPL